MEQLLFAFFLLASILTLNSTIINKITEDPNISEKVYFVRSGDARLVLDESTNVGYIDVAGNNSNGFKVSFRAFNRSFDVVAARGFNFLPVVDPEATVVTGNGISPRPFREDFFLGRLLGSPRCNVQGYFIQELPRMTVYCPEEVYDIEPALHGAEDFNCFVFRQSDVLKQMCGDKLCYKMDTTPQDPIQEPLNDIRAQFGPPNYHNNKVCGIHLVADHTYREYHNGNEHLIQQEMVGWVAQADEWFKRTDFNGDRRPDNIRIKIKKITILRADSPGYGSLQDAALSVDKTLQELSRWAFPPENGQFCLVVIYSHREWHSTNGVAYMGESATNQGGGICHEGKFPVAGLGRVRLNTALLTNLIQGQIRPGINVAATTAHEIGHSFGAPHDNDKASYGSNPPCGRELRHEQHLMNAYSGSMVSDANTMFSSCSIAKMLPVIRNKGFCLEDDVSAVCGDGVVQLWEECDCGKDPDQCQFVDPCCTPPSGEGGSQPCQVAKHRGMQCSPASQPCCTAFCLVERRTDVLCVSPDRECGQRSYCDGTSPLCPVSTSSPDGTPCQGGRVCQQGACGHSVWSLGQGLSDCRCSPPQDCHVCCQSAGASCVSAYTLGLYSAQRQIFLHSPGTPCGRGGFCDSAGRCRKARSLGVIDSLNKAADESRVSRATLWAVNNWYYLLAAVFFLFLLCALGLGLKSRASSVKKVRAFAQATQTASKRLDRSLGEPQRTQVARLRVLFPEVTEQELARVAEGHNTERAMVRELLDNGHPIKKTFGK